MKKTIFITLSITLIATFPAIAQVGNVWSDFKSYASDLQQYLTDNISDTQPLDSEAQTAINSFNGELNIPNPVAVRRSLNDDITINSLSDNFENNPAVNAKLVGNQIDRQLTRAVAVGVLGEEAQIRTQIKLENLEESLIRTSDSIQEIRENSANVLDDITETAVNISNPLSPLLGQSQSRLIELQLKNIEIENQQSKMIAEDLGQTIRLNHNLQYSNLNLANISQEIEELNRSRRVNTSAEAARLLRTTSQVDLSGRGN
ncbi:hypothetical protein NIES267_18780 [Calothrix parasitica NIES-267]|uniref:Uncharacterized protein n=1 Tax=Calothrix parasitica NIES-267 TaxID=1973488 RepID=A0A1Z4LMS3_9CYAN|nr:hypothetical protein NIES267_18780 [Calothrix parasitica NIES-267]